MKKLLLSSLLILLVSCGSDSEHSYSQNDCSESAKKSLDGSITEGVESFTEFIRTTKTFETIMGIPLADGNVSYSHTVMSSCQPVSCQSGYDKKTITSAPNNLINFICVKKENCLDKSLKTTLQFPDDLKTLLITDLIDSTNSTAEECVSNSNPDILGCMDSRASNYNAQATQSDGTCSCDGEAIYSEETGCVL